MGKFRYRIEGTSSLLKKNIDAPDGWKDDESTFDRSPDYTGIFRKFSANELTFRKSGADLVRKIFSENQYESFAKFFVYEKDFNTYSEFLRFEGYLDFMTYVDKSMNEDGNSIDISVIDSNFWNIIKKRDSLNPQLRKLTSLNGAQIIGFTNEVHYLTLPYVPDELSSFLRVDYNFSPTISHSVPYKVEDSNDQNAKDVENSGNYTQPVGSFYQVINSVNYLEFSIDFYCNFKLLSGPTTFYLKLLRYDQTEVLQEERILATASGQNIGENVVLYYSPLTKDRMDIVNDGDYIILKVESTKTFELNSEFGGYEASVQTFADVNEIPEQQIEGMLIHEALTRNLQLLTGKSKPLYSELLGRVNSEPRSYDQNGELSNLFLTDGKLIRGWKISEAPLSLSWKDGFNMLNAITPIGIGIELIDGEQTIRLEKKRYFYDDRIVLTIDNASNTEKKVYDNFIYNKISSGYEKAEYEERNGLNEFNQKSEFSTPIEVSSNELKALSPINADSNGIQNARKKPKSEFPTEDTRYDANRYVITTIISDPGSEIFENTNFESWTDDNTPDSWVVVQGGVLRKYLLGSNRLFFNAGLPIPFIEQTKTLTEINGGTIKISYASIGSGGLSASGYIYVTIQDGADYHKLQSDGTWITESTPDPIAVFFMNLVPNVPESELQSFYSFSLQYQAMPSIGNCTVGFSGIGGACIDDFFFGAGIATSQYLAKTNEDYLSIINAPFGASSFNLDISPARNLRNHGSDIRASLENRLGEYIRFNTSDKNSNLKTQKVGETSQVIENEDILIANLENPYLRPIIHEFDVPITKEIIDILNSTFDGETKQKYLGIIRFRKKETENYTYIWLTNLSTGGEKGNGRITGVEVNIDYVVPIEI